MSDEYPTIVSFYTETWEYPQYAQRMEQSCRKLGLQSHIAPMEDTGQWLHNTRLKPQFIYDTIRELERPLLWIDVDGSIMRKPDLLKEGYPFDFAARKMPVRRNRTWHVGTMYFNYTDATLAFLEDWCERMVDAKGSDELVLDEMWREQTEQVKNLRIGELPAEYFEMLRALNHVPSHGTIICHRASKAKSKLEMKKRLKEKKLLTDKKG